LAVDDWPYCGLPPIDGAVVFVGATAAITAVAAEDAVPVPAEFVALTKARIVLPTSALVRTYVVAVAPAMSPQPLPMLSQRRH